MISCTGQLCCMGRESCLCPASPHSIHFLLVSYLLAISDIRSVMGERERDGDHIHITSTTVYCYNCSILLLLIVTLFLCLVDTLRENIELIFVGFSTIQGFRHPWGSLRGGGTTGLHMSRLPGFGSSILSRALSTPGPRHCLKNGVRHAHFITCLWDLSKRMVLEAELCLHTKDIFYCTRSSDS